VSNWLDATTPSPEMIRLILLLQREQYELTGRWPTAEQILAALKRPGL